MRPQLETLERREVPAIVIQHYPEPDLQILRIDAVTPGTTIVRELTPGTVLVTHLPANPAEPKLQQQFTDVAEVHFVGCDGPDKFIAETSAITHAVGGNGDDVLVGGFSYAWLTGDGGTGDMTDGNGIGGDDTLIARGWEYNNVYGGDGFDRIGIMPQAMNNTDLLGDIDENGLIVERDTMLADVDIAGIVATLLAGENQ